MRADADDVSRWRPLERALRSRVEGEVRFDAGSRALYATDGSNYRQTPIGVVIPKNVRDVEEAVACCREHGAPLLSRGGGTSLAGQCCNAGVVIDFSKHLNKVLSIDARRKVAVVEPGVILDDLREKAKKQGLTFGPDPATHNHCTLGGMIGNNSCGIHSVMAGRTSDNVVELDVLTYEGLRLRVGRTPPDELERIIKEGGPRGALYAGLRDLRDRYGELIRKRYPNIPRRVSGYNLPDLLPENGFHVARALVGSECTCVVVLQATVRLVDHPPVQSLLVVGFEDVFRAADRVVEVRRFKPMGLEGLDDQLVQDCKKKGEHLNALPLLPKGKGWLLVEFGGQTKAEADARAEACRAALEGTPGVVETKLFDDKKQEETVWQVRESGLGATAFLPGEKPTWEGWEDSAVPPEKLGSYLRGFRQLTEKYGYKGDLYGHFGDGCLHTRISFDLFTADGVAKYRRFIDEAADLCVAHGGSLSGEHGDGQSRAALLPKMYGEELVLAFREFKRLWDPRGKMNPGKVVDAYQPVDNLRLGPDYRPREPETHFQYPDDDGSFSHAVLRCVGVGKCRRMDGGVMCPSFMVTREEKHSTRGRAHLLFELLRGQVIGPSWKEEAVKESLDLCLACKGCKSDCPINVDMATYKAEFLSHYYKHRLRPRSAYSMGLIHWWARAASLAPGLANFIGETPPFSTTLKLLGGVAPQRQLPKFAPQTFRSWFSGRRGPRGRRGPVFLYIDTFNDHFHPEIGRAAVEVLEAAGYEVELSRKVLCCGRPLYDYGMLGLAKRLLQKNLRELRPQLETSAPIVMLEPSCAAVFRDELVNLFPNDHDAQRLSQQVKLLAEFIDERHGDLGLKLEGKALVQKHCHQHAVIGFDAEMKVLQKLGLQVQSPETGCCGMAGSFGFEKGERYEVSIKCGERKLFPEIEQLADDALILADGFSCREQILQGTGRTALHLAEALKLALDKGGPPYVHFEEPQKKASRAASPERRPPHVGGG